MSLSTFLTDLDAARGRFRQLLAGKNITVGNGATIIDCLDLLADYWDVAAPVVTPGRLNLYLYYNGSKYLLGSGVNADFSDYFFDGSSGYAIVSGVLGSVTTNGVFSALQIENNTGWSKLGGGVGSTIYGIRNGRLFAIYPSSVVQVGSDSGWTDITKAHFYINGSGYYYTGIRNGQLYIIQGTAALQISESTGWRLLVGEPSAVTDADGKLYQVTLNGPVLKSEMQGWTHLTGWFPYPSSNDENAVGSYGICAGKLYRYETGGSFSQVGISDQWSCVSGNYTNTSRAQYPLAICNGQLYYVSRYVMELLDASTGYTYCTGVHIWADYEWFSGFAIRNDHLIGHSTRYNNVTNSFLVEISSRTISRICGTYDSGYICYLGAAEYLTLDAPEELYLYSGETVNDDPDEHEWSDSDVLSVRVLDGATALPTHCKGFNGVDFETDALSHLCAGYRVLCDVGHPIADGTTLTIQWLRGETVVKTETRPFALDPEPRYFVRPTGEGNYSLKIGGTAVEAEVFYNDEWIDFPDGVLSSTYAGCPVRAKTAPAQDAIACWSDDGVDGDPFWYLT